MGINFRAIVGGSKALKECRSYYSVVDTYQMKVKTFHVIGINGLLFVVLSAINGVGIQTNNPKISPLPEAT